MRRNEEVRAVDTLLSSNGLLALSLAALGAISLTVSRRVHAVDSFFLGKSEDGGAPGMWTLALSQVTTWIFARSLLNAALLGYAFGVAGVLGYTAYYLSFLSGGLIIDRLRFQNGYANIQTFMASEYGRFGEITYNILVAIRLVSELFANLLVVGLIFGVTGGFNYYTAILAVTAMTLLYSMMGGLHASLRTDVVQMVLFLAMMTALLSVVLFGGAAAPAGALESLNAGAGPGWILLAVALLQALSYPMHDPVMMDRGFLADRTTTWRSFLHAFWLSSLCIFAFGMIGVHAGLHKLPGEALTATLQRIMDQPTFLLINVALLVSAMSTLDSALASASKLAISDMGLARRNVRNGRIAMFVFMAAGLAMLLVGSDDLFSAVAVSGTAAMFLTPVIAFRILGGIRTPLWSYKAAFASAIAGAALYFTESSGYSGIFPALFGPMHAYTILLAINAAILAIGMGAFAAGALANRRSQAGPTPRPPA